MSFVVKVFNAFDNRDIEAVADLCHEHFVRVDDYSMTTRDEWLASDKNQFENDCLHFTETVVSLQIGVTCLLWSLHEILMVSLTELRTHPSKKTANSGGFRLIEYQFN